MAPEPRAQATFRKPQNPAGHLLAAAAGSLLSESYQLPKAAEVTHHSPADGKSQRLRKTSMRMLQLTRLQ